MNLREKLERLDKSPRGETEPPETTAAPQENWIEDFQFEFDARIIREQNSFVVLKENYYPLYRDPAFERLREKDFRLRQFHLINNQQAARDFNLRQCLFLDLETTGLAGGTGTYAFLVGVGHLELDHIVVRQYLLPDFQHEWLLLKLLENALQTDENLVTFNGKSYDVPLIRNRFVLNRLETRLDELLHIDLLHAARRVWKRRLPACDLQTLEREILGETRVQDIPGHIIPQIYFEYIRKRRAFLLRDVLEHNFHDIVFMILLTIRLGQLIDEPLHQPAHAEDLLSIARFYFKNKFHREAKPILDHLLFHVRDDSVLREATYLSAMVHKKLGDFETSRKFMHQLLSRQKDHPRALEELAKYYEHREKDYHSALEVVNQGLEFIQLLEQLGRESPLLGSKADLLRRRNRLMKKIQKTAQATDSSARHSI